MKKHRKRNLVPAKVGIYAMVIFVFYVVGYGILFSLKVKLIKAVFFLYKKQL